MIGPLGLQQIFVGHVSQGFAMVVILQSIKKAKRFLKGCFLGGVLDWACGVHNLKKEVAICERTSRAPDIRDSLCYARNP
jgi:hypothetical protein